MQNNADKLKNPFEKEREFVEMVAAIRAKVAEMEKERIKERMRHRKKGCKSTCC